MKKRLQGRVAIVTGGTSGIGRATALLFAEEGAKVVVAGRDVHRGAGVVDQIKAIGGAAFFVRTDVSKSVDVEKLIEQTIKGYGRIDILFNNASISPVGNALDTSEETWDDVLSVNLKGTFLCTKEALPHMIEAGGGVVINTASVNSFTAMTNEVAYDASKGGVLMFTRATALDFAKNKIRVNCICPGAIDTPMLRALFDASPDPRKARSELTGKHPIGRIGSPEEVARVALFLASDDSSFVTGAAIAVDGGLLSGWP